MSGGRPEPGQGGAFRVLVCASQGRDAELLAAQLHRTGIDAVAYRRASDLLFRTEPEFGALLLTAETLDEHAAKRLCERLDAQPAWSDLPVLVLTAPQAPCPPYLDLARRRHNVTLLDRPIPVLHLVSAVRSALRARQHQYDLRAQLTELQARERALRELNYELSHRVKNTLATVLSLARETMARSEDLHRFRRSFGGRLHSLARAHGLLTRASWRGTRLADIITTAAAPLRDPAEPDSFRASGPPVEVESKPALTLSMVFHELADNAARHGALSAPGGKVDVRWDRDPEDGRRLRIEWVESGGPEVSEPRRRGFGHELIEQGIAYDLQGSASLHFSPNGLRCVIRFPLVESIARMPGPLERSFVTP